MDTPLPPCPYKPFDIPCQGDYGHGGPHTIEVEQSWVDAYVYKQLKNAVKQIAQDLAHPPKMTVNTPLGTMEFPFVASEEKRG